MKSVIIFVSLAIGFLQFFIYYYFKHRRTNKLADKFPGPPAVPILGNIFNFSVKSIADVLKLQVESHKKFGETFRIRILHLVGISTTDPKIVEAILSNPRRNLAKSTFYKFLLPWLGEGIATSSGKKWNDHRRLFGPQFSANNLEQFIEVFDRQSRILVEKLNDEQGKDVVDISPFIALLSFDVNCETAFGIRVNAQQGAESSYVEAVGKATGLLISRAFKPWKQFDFLFETFARQEKKEIDDLLKILNNFADKIINERRNYLINLDDNSDSEIDYDDRMSEKRVFLDILLLSTVAGKPFSNKEIRDEVNTAIFGGQETTTAALSFTLYQISRHPDVQQKLVDEIKEVIGTDNSKPITYNQLQELRYMDSVIMESMRVIPPIPTIGRYIEQDIVLDYDRIIPADCNVTLNLFITFKNPKYFKDPETFDPERFSPENQAKSKINPYVYTPFSAGVRNCLGQKFALLEIKATLSNVLRNFELLPKGDAPDVVIEVVSHSLNGVQLGLKPRAY